MSIRTRRAPLSMFVLLFSALSTPLGCTAILGEFEVDGAATNAEAGAPETSTLDAPQGETSAEGGTGGHFVAKLVTAGARHTCALTEKNEVFCWGDNADGQLGLPTSTARSERPVKVNLPPDVKSLVAGAFHTCVLTEGFEAFCWGRNACGQVGAGDEQNPSPQPRKVIEANPGQPLQWTAIAPGRDHTCGVESGGATYCWGCNTRAQAGNIGANPSSKPVNAGVDKQNAVAVSAGSEHTCIIGASARVRCWGSEARGALGNGPPLSETSAGSVLAETGVAVTALAAGEHHTCGIDANRRAACWGDNTYGQLGNPDAGVALASPETRVFVPQSTAIGAGAGFSCVIAGDSTVRCFGTNANGELGRSGPHDTETHPLPEPVAHPVAPSAELKAKNIGVGREHACAVLDGTSEVVCWGKGADGQLGDGTAGGPPRTTPVFVRP